MSDGEGPIGKIQAGVVAILMGYFLLKFFDAFPTGDIVNGPFSDAYWIFSLMPWFLVFLGFVILGSMLVEVLKF